MYVILGGAYNGKRNYVEKMLKQKEKAPVHYCEGYIPEVTTIQNNDIVVVSDFDIMVGSMREQSEKVVAQMIVSQLCELAKHAQVICICTDQSRGVVPLEKEVRQMRDTCGRIYQKLCQEATTVLRVWYGLPQVLKGELDYGEK